MKDSSNDNVVIHPSFVGGLIRLMGSVSHTDKPFSGGEAVFTCAIGLLLYIVGWTKGFADGSIFGQSSILTSFIIASVLLTLYLLVGLAQRGRKGETNGAKYIKWTLSGGAMVALSFVLFHMIRTVV